MKYLSIPILLLMLAGCSTTPVALSNAEQPGAGAGILRIAWLGACRTLGSDSEKRPRRGHFLTISQGNGRTIAQEMGEKGAGAVDLQPEIPKSDRLLGPDRAEILLEGKAYVGEWADSLCFTPQCRGVFFNVAKIERRHVRRGSAELFAKDQASLSCEWVSHKKELVGTCQADDGRVFQLKGA